MFSCHFCCHPWDLLDEGAETVLDALQGRSAASGLTLPVVCDGVREVFRPHARALPRVLSTAGGVYFTPDAQLYCASRLTPPPAGETRRRDLLALAGEHCARRGIELRAAVQPLRSTRLTTRHPECARKNLCGYRSLRALCPHNPDVRAYVLALARDLSVYDDVCAVLLDVSATDPQARPLAAPAGFERGAAPELLDLCFCESCLQLAAASGVDGDAALRIAGQRLDRWCEQGPAALGADQEAVLSRYRAWTADGLRRLLRDFKQAVAKPVILQEPGMFLVSKADGDVADALLVQPEHASDQAKAGLPVELVLEFERTAPPDAASLIQTVAGAVALGVTAASVIHYGAVCDWQFDWIRQAVRHARRL